MKLPSFLGRLAPTRKSLANPGAELLELFGAIPSGSGVGISTEAALRVPAVSAAIRTIAETAGSLDVKVVSIARDGAETDAPDHPVAAFLRRDPNDWTSRAELIGGLVSDALIADAGGCAWVNRTGDGHIVEVVKYRRGVVAVGRDLETDEPGFTISGRPMRAADVIHLRAPLGRAPLTLAREAIGVAALLERHAARLFARGARPGGLLKFPRTMGEEAVKRARAAWSATHEGDDSGGRTAILYDDAQFEPLSFSSVDAQFLELRRFQLEEIARAFNIPSPMIGDLTRATWGNLELKHREFFSTTLEPWLLGLEAALRRALFMLDEREHFAIRFDRDDFGRADLTARATAINGLIASRVLSPNEGRDWLGLAPRDGGDVFANPNITETPPAAGNPAEAEENDRA